MHLTDQSPWQHSHNFVGDLTTAEKNTRRVILLASLMMAVEIVAGLKLHSMALFADGCHMSTHLAAFLITACAYAVTRRNAGNRLYSFGAGKVGVLGAYTSAIILAGIALFMLAESVKRLFQPLVIHYNQAIGIAAVGLVVNLVSAFLLKDRPHHGHGHDHGAPAAPRSPSHQHDINLKAAYLHVLADAATSVLAIIALTAGKLWGAAWLDPVMGIVGSAVISQWAYGLIRQTQIILLDKEPEDCDLNQEIRKSIASDGDSVVTDLHIWQVGSNKFAAIISLVAHHPRSPEDYKAPLKEHEELVHVTVEIQQCSGDHKNKALSSDVG
ncbi:MAG: CDF family Co(II)/Ni(II) efflux transporter DmeF [Verrucomicrobiota bacterium]|jgi:cation diffusion facilitator family transporter